MSAQTTLATAIQIGNPVSIRKAIKVIEEFNGIVEQATESELANAAALADRTGLFNCPHTGVALTALFKLIERQEIQKNDRVVVISTATGLKFPEFKVGYHNKAQEEVKPLHRNLPVELAANYDTILQTIDQRFSN